MHWTQTRAGRAKMRAIALSRSRSRKIGKGNIVKKQSSAPDVLKKTQIIHQIGANGGFEKLPPKEAIAAVEKEATRLGIPWKSSAIQQAWYRQRKRHYLYENGAAKTAHHDPPATDDQALQALYHTREFLQGRATVLNKELEAKRDLEKEVAQVAQRLNRIEEIIQEWEKPSEEPA